MLWKKVARDRAHKGLLGQTGSVLLFSLGVALRTEPPALWLVEDLWKFVGKQRINPL